MPRNLESTPEAIDLHGVVKQHTSLLATIREQHPRSDYLTVLKMYADTLPQYRSTNLNELLAVALLAENSAQVTTEKSTLSSEMLQAIVLLYMNSILKALEKFFTVDEQENEDLLNFAIQIIFERYSSRNFEEEYISGLVYRLAQAAARLYFGDQYGIKVRDVQPDNFKQRKAAFDEHQLRLDSVGQIDTNIARAAMIDSLRQDVLDIIQSKTLAINFGENRDRNIAIFIDLYALQGGQALSYQELGKKYNLSLNQVRKIIDTWYKILRDRKERCRTYFHLYADEKYIVTE